MAQDETFFYTHSGKVSLLRLVLVLPLVVLLIALLALAYTAVVWVLPFDGLAFIVVIIFTYFILKLAQVLAKWGHARRNKFANRSALYLALLFWYLQWIMFLIRADADYSYMIDYLPELVVVFRPDLVVQSLIDYFPNQGYHWSWWLFEAIFLISLPPLRASTYLTMPYSEARGRWYAKHQLQGNFLPIEDKDHLTAALQQSVPEAVNNLKANHQDTFSNILIFYLKGEETQYLSISNLNHPINKKDSPYDGASNRKEILAIKPLHLFKITTANADELMRLYNAKRARSQLAV